MKFYAHRINTINELSKISSSDGVEIDLRAYKDEIILAHDPFMMGESFENFLEHYGHSGLILNVKSERIEFKVLELLKKYQIKDYFFLDSSIPMSNLLFNKAGETNIAVRFSELEPLEGILPFAHKAKWVWVDCFTKFILTKEIEEKIHELGFKICLVSPELQGREEDIEKYVKTVNANGLCIDAICTKIRNKEKWLSPQT